MITFGIFGSAIGIWLPFLYFLFLRLMAGEPLSDELIRQLEINGWLFAFIFGMASIIVGGILGYLVYDPAKNKKEEVVFFE